MTVDLDAAFAEALVPLLRRLEIQTQQGAHRLEVIGETAVAVTQRTAGVPVRYALHWRRFKTVPTDLVRELAYALRRVQRVRGEGEAEWLLFAEVFLRDEVLSHD